MKKIIFAIAIVLTISFSASAQSDGFFRGGDGGGNRTDISGTTPLLPQGGVGASNSDQTGVPLGSGLLILTALGTGYAVTRKRNH